ncbi:MAG: hypothetical protein K2W96_11475 [Gemmataceae bacterium]|nr:hypothetical protein [Gemmataceae bacterium]
MIRFDCDDCERPFKVGDDYAGKLIRCPDCKSAVRVPPAEEPEESPKRKAVRQAEDDPPPRRKRAIEEEDEPAPSQKRLVDREDDRPRKKKRKSEQAPGSRAFIFLALGLTVLFVLLGSLSFYFKHVAVVMFVIGIVPVVVGTWWVLAIAKDEVGFEYLACKWVPFYDTWFALSRWGVTWAACLMCWIGRVFAVTAAVLFLMQYLHEKGKDGRWDRPPVEIDSECADLLKSTDATETRAWLAAPRRIGTVKVGKVGLRVAVEGLYEKGAVRVTFADMMIDEDADAPEHLVIELPADKDKRKAVVNYVNTTLLDIVGPPPGGQGAEMVAGAYELRGSESCCRG